ncbi:CDP-alcohol phosphatidyltransferase family protein [Candidatus Kuenenbacteria bacterium]|nr:CDP-alcohol phosphatidyltransferase family protein [Candidatus Kuenenbacteria bacterium]
MWEKLDKQLEVWNVKIQKTKDGWLKRPLFYLHKLGLTGNIISTAKVALAVIALGVVKYSLPGAVVIFLSSYIFDVFDGSLARYSGQNSDRGKFIDVLTDQAVYTLAVLAMIRIDLLNVKALAYNLLAVPVVYLLVIIQRNENRPSDWLIKPVAKLNYYKSPLYAAAVGLVAGWFSFGFANGVLYVSNVAVTLHIIYAYIIIVSKHDFKKGEKC